jgi:hypothetical protein
MAEDSRNGRRATQWGGELVKTIGDESGDREVRIVKNRDGSFGYEEWRFSRYPGEECWIPQARRGRTFAATPDAAEREARTSVEWLIGLEAE